MPDPFARHARSKWDWDSPRSRSGGVRAAAADDPEPARRSPARKDTRHWCKGKEGREHVLILEPAGHRAYLRLAACGWASMWHIADQDYALAWACLHREICENCGRVFREPWQIPAQKCPEYPGDDGQRAAAEAKVAEDRARRPYRLSWRRRPVITGPQGYRRPKAGKR